MTLALRVVPHYSNWLCQQHKSSPARQPIFPSQHQVNSRSKNKKMNKPELILVAGPYRSGTNDQPELIAANVEHMSQVSLQLYRKGHLPVMGEWFALPLIETAGSKEIGDAVFNEIFHPVAIRLLDKVDAVLRIGGPSQGADEMVRIGLEKGKKAYFSVEEID
jgi:hypothetical protein